MPLPAHVARAARRPARYHVCSIYDRHDEFVHHALEFLDEGLGKGQRVCYVGLDDVDVVARQLHGEPGAVHVTSLDSLFPAGRALDPVEQVRVYAEQTDLALAAGFTGLRMAGNGTTLARSTTEVDTVGRYEHLVDRCTVDRPFSALCAYDGRELADGVAERLACLHRDATPGATPFHLHAGTTGVGSVALRGEVDSASADLLVWALERARPHTVAGELVVDAAELGFIDHRGLVALDQYARDTGMTLVLRASLPSAVKIIGILGLANVRVAEGA